MQNITKTLDLDWAEDFSHENGNYQNRCNDCGELFIGHKRRTFCKLCSTVASPNAQSVVNSIPRRTRLDLNVPAELAIYNAIQEIEKIGADIRLTKAINLLSEAKDFVSDYVDDTLTH